MRDSCRTGAILSPGFDLMFCFIERRTLDENGIIKNTHTHSHTRDRIFRSDQTYYFMLQFHKYLEMHFPYNMPMDLQHQKISIMHPTHKSVCVRLREIVSKVHYTINGIHERRQIDHALFAYSIIDWCFCHRSAAPRPFQFDIYIYVFYFTTETNNENSFIVLNRECFRTQNTFFVLMVRMCANYSRGAVQVILYFTPLQFDIKSSLHVHGIYY